jgi:PAS domain S-box-containing protein
MKDQSRTKQALIQELTSLRQRIAERDQSQSDTDISEVAFETIFRKHDVIMLLMSGQTGQLIDANDAALRFYGYSIQQIKSMKIGDINKLPPDELDAERQRAVKEERKYFIVPHLLANGEIRTVEVHTTPIIFSNITCLFSVIHDITERKQAEEALGKSEAKYYSIFDNAVEGIFQTTPEGRYVSVNPALARMFGYGSPENMMSSVVDIGRQLYVNPEQRKEHLRLLNEKEVVENYEAQMYRKDRSIFWVSINTRLVRDDSGNPRCYEGFVVDITERKQAEEERQLDQGRLKSIMNSIPDGVYIVDQQCNIQYINPVIEKEFGSVNGRKCYTYFHDRIEVCPWCKNAEVFAGKSVRWEWYSFKNDRHYDLFDIPFKNSDGSIAKFEIFHDITERKRAEEVLRISEGRYRMAEAIGHVGNWEYNLQTTKFWGSDEAKRIYGFDPEALDFSTDEVENCIPERERVHQALVDLIEADKPYNLEFEIHPKNSLKPRIISSVAALKRDEHGNPLLVTGVIQDITERKQAEAQLHASLREKDILLNEIHHRVKNNMQVISSLLKLQASASGSPELTERLNVSRDRIHAMALVHEKLYNSKDFSRINLVGYVRTLSQGLFPSFKIGPSEIDMIVQADGDVYVDINKAIPCGLIMNELISNVLKHAFLGDGPGTLQIIIRETENTEIEIVVRDNGLGLPDKVDIHAPRSLGLDLVNGLVKNQLDGQIEVKRDKGTEFRIKFPL